MKFKLLLLILFSSILSFSSMANTSMNSGEATEKSSMDNYALENNYSTNDHYDDDDDDDDDDGYRFRGRSTACCEVRSFDGYRRFYGYSRADMREACFVARRKCESFHGIYGGCEITDRSFI